MYVLMARKAFSSLMLLLVLLGTTEPKEILSYQNGDTTRIEEGTPGSSVTGEWSWMDYNGQKRTIRYVADEKGFRAFGDVVPETKWSQGDEIPEIGSSVAPSMSTIDDDEASFPNIDSKKDEEKHILEEQKIEQNFTDSTESNNNSSTKSQSGMNTEQNFVHDSLPQMRNNSATSKIRESTPLIFENERFQKPRKIPGTSFILLSHMRLPAREPAADVPRVSHIKPSPVEMSGSVPSAITGILTAPRAINVLDHKIGKDLISVPSPIHRNIPKPSKVEGMLNLDNYLRPAHITTSNIINQTPSPSENDYDYYYYDYYYEDRPNGQKAKKNNTKTRTVRSEESKESLEDFEYHEDLSKERRRV